MKCSNCPNKATVKDSLDYWYCDKCWEREVKAEKDERDEEELKNRY